MRYMSVLAYRSRTIALALIAAAAIAAVPLALSPPSAQGSPESPATMEECGEELTAGRAVACARGRFAVTTVRPDGEYQINWSAWADGRQDVDRYSIQRLRFMYRYDFTREDDGTSVDDADYTVPDTRSCRPWGMERDGQNEVTRYAWFCTGISNVRVDPSGGPTSAEQLEAYSDSYTLSDYSGSLLAPGRKHDVPVQALLIPGDKEEPHPDNPQSWRDRLTTQQVEDGTTSLLASEVEMHLYVIYVHYDGGRVSRYHELITGGPFDDR
ncbi:MAG: hypothetical protein OXL97_02200 [Chloroflexota bacterium]|nr:hypothetical protein [Chloroflexota bacterium]MDE2884774.1 hypothetical protein [Chloroflexota bacterium]